MTSASSGWGGAARKTMIRVCFVNGITERRVFVLRNRRLRFLNLSLPGSGITVEQFIAKSKHGMCSHFMRIAFWS
jgi:hypothetical protein